MSPFTVFGDARKGVGIPSSKIFGKLNFGGVPKVKTEFPTYCVEKDTFVGSFKYFSRTVVSKTLFHRPLQFQPVLLQSRKKCSLKEHEDTTADTKVESNDFVGVAITTPTQFTDDGPDYRIYIDLRKSQFVIENGTVFTRAVMKSNTSIVVDVNDDIDPGNMIFMVYADNSINVTRVDNVEIDDTNKTVEFSDPGTMLVPIKHAGWLMESDFPEIETDQERIRKVIEQHEKLKMPSEPRMAGVVGPMQADQILLWDNIIHIMVLTTMNAKLMVDKDFYTHKTWLPNDSIYMVIGVPNKYIKNYSLNDVESKTTTRYEVRYRGEEAPPEPDWTPIWRCRIGKFLKEDDLAYQHACTVLLWPVGGEFML